MTATDTITAAELDQGKLEELVGRFATDLGAVLHASTVLIGDRLGLYKAMSTAAGALRRIWPSAREPICAM